MEMIFSGMSSARGWPLTIIKAKTFQLLNRPYLTPSRLRYCDRDEAVGSVHPIKKYLLNMEMLQNCICPVYSFLLLFLIVLVAS